MDENKNDFFSSWRKSVINNNSASLIVFVICILPFLIIFALIITFTPNPFALMNILAPLSFLVLGSSFLLYLTVYNYYDNLDKSESVFSNKLIYKIIARLDLFLNGPRENRKIFNRGVIIEIVITLIIITFFLFRFSY